MEAQRIVRFLVVSILCIVGPSFLIGAEAKEAPVFRLPGIDGKEYALSDFQGQPVVLSFFATWCSYCAEELPVLEKLYREYSEKASLVILGIDLQEPKNLVAGFVERIGVSFPVLLDEKGETAFSYQTLWLPTLFFINPQGQIVDMILGGSDEATIRRKLERILWFRGLLLPEVRNLVEILDEIVVLDLRSGGTNPFPEKKNIRYETVCKNEDLSRFDPQGIYVILATTSGEGKDFASSMTRKGFRHVYYLLVDDSEI